MLRARPLPAFIDDVTQVVPNFTEQQAQEENLTEWSISDDEDTVTNVPRALEPDEWSDTEINLTITHLGNGERKYLRLSEEVVNFLDQAVQARGRLNFRELNFSVNFNCLTAYLRSRPGIKDLSLKPQMLVETIPPVIENFWPSQLESFSMRDNRLTASTLISFIETILTTSSLKRLDMSNSYDKARSLTLFGTLTASPSFDALLDPSSEKLKLLELDISSNNLGDKSAKDVFLQLEKNTRLQKLNISNNHLTDASLHTLSEILTKNTTLRFIDLSNNRFSPQAVVSFLEALFENETKVQCKLANNQVANHKAPSEDTSPEEKQAHQNLMELYDTLMDRNYFLSEGWSETNHQHYSARFRERVRALLQLSLHFREADKSWGLLPLEIIEYFINTSATEFGRKKNWTTLSGHSATLFNHNLVSLSENTSNKGHTMCELG